MKKLISLMLVLMFISGCSSAKNIDNIEIAKIEEVLLTSDIFDGQLVAVADDDIKNIYMLPDYDNKIKEAILYVSGDNNISEIAIFKSDEDLKHLIEERVKYLQADATNYFADQLYKFDDYYLYSNDGLYILVISANNDSVDELVKSVIN